MKLLQQNRTLKLTRLTSLTVTKQYRHSPFTGCGRATTAVSATSGCSMRTDSTSAVLSRCPDTFSMSSMRPVIHKYPSASRRAPAIQCKQAAVQDHCSTRTTRLAISQILTITSSIRSVVKSLISSIILTSRLQNCRTRT